jgi:hypothetical protein
MSQAQKFVPAWMSPLQIFSICILFAAGILFYGAFMLTNPAYVGSCLVGGIAVTIASVIGWLTSLRLKNLEARLNRLEAALQTPVPEKGTL